MIQPTIRIPKNLLPAVEQAATQRGVSPAVLTAQALRFYLAATDPQLVANAVAEALKPIASDIRHIRYRLDRPTEETATAVTSSDRHDLIQQLVEQKRQATLARLHPTAADGGHP